MKMRVIKDDLSDMDLRRCKAALTEGASIRLAGALAETFQDLKDNGFEPKDTASFIAHKVCRAAELVSDGVEYTRKQPETLLNVADQALLVDIVIKVALECDNTIGKDTYLELIQKIKKLSIEGRG